MTERRELRRSSASACAGASLSHSARRAGGSVRVLLAVLDHSVWCSLSAGGYPAGRGRSRPAL